MKKPYTHYGWFGLCPVLLAFDGDNIDMRPRWLPAEPLFWLSVFTQSLAIGVCSLINPAWEPVWRVKVTGKIE